jgi:hypothetical protein
MSTQYIVANPEFWESIPNTRQLTCGRVKFCKDRVLGPRYFADKAEAVREALSESKIMVRETKHDTTHTDWTYQLLLGVSNA